MVFVALCVIAALLIYLGLRSNGSPAKAQDQAGGSISAISNYEAAAEAYERAADVAEAPQLEDAGPQGGQLEGEGPPALSKHPAFQSISFADYAAEPIRTRQPLPQLRGDRETLETFKSALLKEARMGVNFGGHYRIARVGCGTRCVFSFIIDLKTGVVEEFAPRGRNGEDATGEQQEARPDSTLILDVAPEEDDGGNITCSYIAFEWRDGRPEPVTAPIRSAAEGCG